MLFTVIVAGNDGTAQDGRNAKRVQTDQVFQDELIISACEAFVQLGIGFFDVP